MDKLDGIIPVWGRHDDNTLAQIRQCAESADQTALMADGHMGYGVPIGGVVAYKDRISPSAVGYDIACGNKAVRLDVPAAYVRANAPRLADEINSIISFGVGRKNDERVEAPLFDDLAAWALDSVKPLRDKAMAQLGTVGSGNHYVDVFSDEQDRTWVGVHFGSRGFGHGIATWFLKAMGATDDMMAKPAILEVSSDLGEQYLRAMEIGGQYAYAGRDWVCDRVARIIGGSVLDSVHNHHNFAWRETHNGDEMWVCRKGATPAFPSQRGFVGGSMGENSVILHGVESDYGADSMYSTIHGAGRVMGRKQATGVIKKNKTTGEVRVVREPMVTQDMMQEWVTRAGIELRGAGVDESPHCYKRLDEVLEYHSGMVEIEHVLTPIIVVMAGSHEFDPYKD